jgi:hypothetical protein
MRSWLLRDNHTSFGFQTPWKGGIVMCIFDILTIWHIQLFPCFTSSYNTFVCGICHKHCQLLFHVFLHCMCICAIDNFQVDEFKQDLCISTAGCANRASSICLLGVDETHFKTILWHRVAPEYAVCVLYSFWFKRGGSTILFMFLLKNVLHVLLNFDGL